MKATSEIIEAAKAAMTLNEFDLANELVKDTDLSVIQIVGCSFNFSYEELLLITFHGHLIYVLVRNCVVQNADLDLSSIDNINVFNCRAISKRHEQ